MEPDTEQQGQLNEQAYWATLGETVVSCLVNTPFYQQPDLRSAGDLTHTGRKLLAMGQHLGDEGRPDLRVERRHLLRTECQHVWCSEKWENQAPRRAQGGLVHTGFLMPISTYRT
jgi:hypothetical protein